VTTFDQLIARAQATAQRLLREQLEHFPAVRSTEEAMRVLHDIELDVYGVGHELVELQDAGLLTQGDVLAFNQLRTNLQAAQRRLLVFIRGIFFDRQDVLARLPTSIPLAPMLGPSYRNPTLPENMSAWAIAGIVIAILIALGMMVYAASRLYDSFDGLVDLYILREQSQQMHELYTARLEALRQCIAARQAAGQPDADCYNNATQVVPTPAAALVPRAPKSSSGLWWFLGGMAVVAGLVGLGAYLVYRKPSPGSTKGIRGYRQLSAEHFDEGHDSDYQLEVER
jgi:hypothetical protein